MSKFKFKLQSVLDLRHRELGFRRAEREARRHEAGENLAKQSQVGVQQRELEADFIALGRAAPAQFIHCLDYRHRLKLSLDELKVEHAVLEERVSLAEQAVQEASRAHRRLELLKERALEEFLAEEQHQEIQRIDEWGSLSAARKKS